MYRDNVFTLSLKDSVGRVKHRLICHLRFASTAVDHHVRCKYVVHCRAHRMDRS